MACLPRPVSGFTLLGVRVVVRLRHISGTAFVFALGCGAGIGGVLAILWCVVWLGINRSEGLAFLGAIVGAGLTVAGAIYLQTAHARDKRATEIKLITALFQDLRTEATQALGPHIGAGERPLEYPNVTDLGILAEKTRHISEIALSEAQHLHFHEIWALTQAHFLLKSYLEFDQDMANNHWSPPLSEDDHRDWNWAHDTLGKACRIISREFPAH